MVDYEFYATVYYGDRLEDDNEFKRLAMDAELTVDHFAFGRLSGEIPYIMTPEVENLVKLTICKLMDHIKDYNILSRDGIKSESIDDVSVTFKDYKQEDLDKTVEEVVYVNLGKTGLLNRYYSVRW